MEYISYYISPLGRMLIAADDEGLTGLWFEGQRYFALHLDENHEEKETPVLSETKRWLDIYFSGSRPDFTPSLHITGSDFHREVSDIMRTIPYGKTMTYGEIAALIAEKKGGRVSARAVGGAVGHNRISIIIPCHRVIGSNGNLTGYAGGLDRKIRLLELEGADAHVLRKPR